MNQDLAPPRPVQQGSPTASPGAVVVGGDFLGLGIARSLGEHGIPVCVIDDERSIARYSRFVSHAVRVDDLRDEDRAVDALIRVARERGLEGWVLFPTRDETVVACSRRRAELSEWFRLTVADWDSVCWTADKRLTYRLAGELGVPAPRVFAPDGADAQDGDFPLVLKPAFKPPFIYSTGVKAWRVNSRSELRDRVDQASQV